MKINLNDESEIKELKKEVIENTDMTVDKLHNDYIALNLQNVIVAKKLNIHQNYVSKLFRKREMNLLYNYSFLLRLFGYKLVLKDLKVDHFSTNTKEIKNNSIKAYNNIMSLLRDCLNNDNTLLIKLKEKFNFPKMITLENITEVTRASSKLILFLQLAYYIGKEIMPESIGDENKVEKFIDNVEKNNNYIKSYKAANNGTYVVEKIFNKNEEVKNNDVPKRNLALTRKIGDEISLDKTSLKEMLVPPETKPRKEMFNRVTSFNSNEQLYNNKYKNRGIQQSYSIKPEVELYDQNKSSQISPYEKQIDRHIHSSRIVTDTKEKHKPDNSAFLKSIINYQEELDKIPKSETEEHKEAERKEMLHYYVEESRDKKNMIFRKVKSDEEKLPYDKQATRNKIIPAFTEYMVKLNMKVNEMIEDEVDQEVILNIIKNNKMIYDDNISFNIEDFLNKESSRKDLVKIRENMHQQEDDIIEAYLSMLSEEEQEEVLEKRKLIKQVRDMEETCLSWLYSNVNKKKKNNEDILEEY